MKPKSLKINVILNVIYTITNLIFPLLTYPYVARMLSTSGLGKVNFFSSISSYAIMLAALGISTYGIRATARVRNSFNDLSKIVSELLLINLLSTAVIVIILSISVFFVSEFRREATLFLINMLIVVLAPFSLDWLYSGLEQYAYITRRNFLFKIISLILVFCLVHKPEDYIIYAAIIAFSSIGTYVCNFTFSKKFVKIRFSKKLRLQKHLKPMLLLFASILAVSVYTNLDTIMLGFISGNKEVSYYTMATKIETILLSAVNAISAALLPRLSNYIGNKKISQFNDLLKKSVSFIFLITIPLTFYFILEAKDCIFILGGNQYNPAVLSMQILMPILMISGFSNVTGNQILIPKGRDAQFMQAILLGAVVDLILNIFLMPRFQATGASISTLFAELVQMSVQLYYAKKDIFKSMKLRTIILSLLDTFIASFSIVMLHLKLNMYSVLSLFITSILFFLIYIVLLIMEREEYTMYILKSLFKKLHTF